MDGALDVFGRDLVLTIEAADDDCHFVATVALSKSIGDPAGASYRGKLLVRHDENRAGDLEAIEHRRARARDVENRVSVIAGGEIDQQADAVCVDADGGRMIG